MRYVKAQTDVKLEDLQLSKMILKVGEEDRENIWVKVNGDKSYLQNHALNFHPFPTWGMEVPTLKEYDLAPIRKDPKDCVLTLHPEAYDHLLEQGWIGEDGELLEKFFKDNNIPEDNETE